ncbi:uncharacterized protein HD556DRAFT_1223950, partial [Suillus plorans]
FSHSALAAVSYLRSLAAFVIPLFYPVMYTTLGFGKGDTILAVVAIVIGCSAPWISWHYGSRYGTAVDMNGDNPRQMKSDRSKA